MYIKPSPNSKSLWSINEDLASEALLIPLYDASCPWDAEINIVEDKVILEGSIIAGGPVGTCTCEIPISKFSKYYKIEIPDNTSDDVLQDLNDNGWSLDTDEH